MSEVQEGVLSSAPIWFPFTTSTHTPGRSVPDAPSREEGKRQREHRTFGKIIGCLPPTDTCRRVTPYPPVKRWNGLR